MATGSPSSSPSASSEAGVKLVNHYGGPLQVSAGQRAVIVLDGGSADLGPVGSAVPLTVVAAQHPACKVTVTEKDIPATGKLPVLDVRPGAGKCAGGRVPAVTVR